MGSVRMACTPHGPESGTNGIQGMVAACLDTSLGGKEGFTKRFSAKPYIDDLLHGTPDHDNLERSEKLSRLFIEDHERQLREILAY